MVFSPSLPFRPFGLAVWIRRRKKGEGGLGGAALSLREPADYFGIS
jgi:hypothetical protein